jgi:iron complex transport system substrate-binding protein
LAASVDYPEAAKSATEVGTAYQPNFEQILALKPDLVVADAIIHAQPALRQPFEDLPVPVIFAGADSYQKVVDGLNLMGTVLDSKATTDKVITGIGKARDDAKKALAGKTVTALALIGDRDGTLYAAKPSSYAGDVLAQLGITNPAASQPDSGPFPGYTAVAPEKMVQYDPDFIFAISAAPAPAPKLADTIKQIPPFKGLKAITGNKVIDANVELFLQAPGPRIADAFKAVAAAVTAP